MVKLVFWIQAKPGTAALANSEAKLHPVRGDIQAICPGNAKLGRMQDKRRWLEDGRLAADWHGLTAVLEIIDLDIAQSKTLRSKRQTGNTQDAHRLWTINVDAIPAGTLSQLQTDGFASVTFAEVSTLITRKDTGAVFNPTLGGALEVGAGLFTTPTELKALDLTAAPYAAAWSDLQSRLNPSIALQSTVDGGPNDCGGSPPNQFCTTDRSTRLDYVAAQNMSYAARDLAIAYQLTGTESYATKAIQIIEYWMVGANRMAPSLTTVIGSIEQYITIPAMFHAANLLRGHSAWTNFAAVTQWALDFGQSCYAYRNTEQSSNKLDWLIYCCAAAFSFIQDATKLGQTLDFFSAKQIDRILSDGRIAADYNRSNGLSYSTYALLAMCGTAEIAWRAGRDLYTGDLVKALDYHAPYALNPSTWPYSQSSPFNNDNIECFEMANKRKPSSAYANVVSNKPIWGSRTVGPSTLLFA